MDIGVNQKISILPFPLLKTLSDKIKVKSPNRIYIKGTLIPAGVININVINVITGRKNTGYFVKSSLVLKASLIALDLDKKLSGRKSNCTNISSS